MITGTHDTVATQPPDLLRTMLEEQFAVHTARLTELSVHGRLHGRAPCDADTLAFLMASARQGIADTAQALRRMAEGTYGICETCRRAIPVGRLHRVPYATRCGLCATGDADPTGLPEPPRGTSVIACRIATLHGAC